MPALKLYETSQYPCYQQQRYARVLFGRRHGPEHPQCCSTSYAATTSWLNSQAQAPSATSCSAVAAQNVMRAATNGSLGLGLGKG